ncbi:MAG: hypothetical protein R3E88_10525 [Myxococcota bacterium]
MADHTCALFRSHRRRAHARGLLGVLGLGVALLLVGATAAMAGPVERDRAKRIHDRLVGVPPDETTLTLMEQDIVATDVRGAAFRAMAHPEFFTTSLKNWITPWTNEEQTSFAPLNDYTATVIGIVRDGRPFTEVLYDDVLYVGASSLGLTPYSHDDNFHYEELEAAHVDLSNPTLLVRQTQSGQSGSQVQASEAAGVLTTRAAGKAFFRAGTNRRMWRYTAMNFLCRDMEQLSDNTRPADRVRQDVSRSPGGDSSVFLNMCVGCHAPMDAVAGAFAYFEWVPDPNDPDLGRVVHTPGAVQGKYLINATTFPFGYLTTDNRWDNYWREGDYSVLGWNGPSSGGWGAKSLGQEIALSDAFAECQVQKIWKRVCFREPANLAERQEVSRIATDVFAANSYDIREAFAAVAEYCMDD